MRRAALVAAALMSTSTLAAEEPLVIGWIKNRGDGEIVFLSTTVNCKTGQRGYVRDDGGRMALFFCWRLESKMFWVTYDDGDRYSYPLDSINLTPEYMAYLNEKQGDRL